VDQKDDVRKPDFQEYTRVARFFMVHETKTGKNVTNEHKMYQMVIKHPKCL
jgi:hypothetical protein